MTAPTRPRIAVIIATLGRPEIVSATLHHLLDQQTVKPDQVIVSCVSPSDAGDLGTREGVDIVTGPKGLPTQRNTGLDRLHSGTGIVIFFDDDFVAAPHWIEAACELFAARADVTTLTGHVIADGILGPGISFDEALRLVALDRAPETPTLHEPFSPYGCNMAFRFAAIGSHRFDERLILYGWLEDRDFGARIGQSGGRPVRYSAARGVHMGVKRGRVAGHQFGYSQIANPLYLLRKGSMTPVQVIDHIGRNVMSNLAKSLFPEPFIDRRGRLLGNLRAVGDLLRGRLAPERAAGQNDRKSAQRR